MSEPGSLLLFILGAGVFGGMLGAWFFQRLHIPQVVGYLVAGLVVGESGLQLVRVSEIHRMEPVVIFSLGVIGFLVGGELKLDEFRRCGRQYLAIMVGGGLGAFFPVGLVTGLIVWMLGAGWEAALAAGCTFGAIAAATDPASTIGVLWEYRAKGAVTSALTAVIVLDAALAIILYSLSTGLAQMLFGQHQSLAGQLGQAGAELGGALLLGTVAALALLAVLRWLRLPGKSLAFALGLLILASAAADALRLDVILVAMAMGCVTVNLNPGLSERLIAELRGFSTPVYALFFFFVGAQLTLGGLPLWLWGIVGAYVVFRTTGKIVGAWIGSRLSGGSTNVSRYVGMGLSTQGGVAIGLSSMACRHFNDVPLTHELSLGQAVVFGITATTLIVQLIGPPLVKLAVQLADETGRDVKEEDVIRDFSVTEVMETGIDPVFEGESLDRVMRRFSGGEYLVYPVVDQNGGIRGMVSLASMKELIVDRDTWQWLLAGDVMEPLTEYAITGEKLSNLLERMAERDREQMAVLTERGGSLAGMVRREHIRKRIAEETLRRQSGVATAKTD